MPLHAFSVHSDRAKYTLTFFLTFLLFSLSFAVLAQPLLTSARQAKSLLSSPLKPVSQLKVGDIIRARDRATGKVAWKQVTHASKRAVASLLKIQLADTHNGRLADALVCPLDQSVRLADGRTVPAGHLSVGNSIVPRAGPVCKVKAMFLLRKPGGFLLCDVRVGPVSPTRLKLILSEDVEQVQPKPHIIANFADYRYADPVASYSDYATAASTGGTVNNFLFQGQQYDPASGDYYLRARYYDPTMGRFLSQDPSDGNSTDPTSLHRYLYASNDPVNRIDPSGREDLESLSISEVGSATLDGIDTGAIQGAKTFAKDAIGEAVDSETPQAIAERGAADTTEEVTADLGDIVELGKEGEAAAEEQIPGFVKNTQHIPDFTGRRAYRIPDQLDKVNKIIGEVKNVKQLDYRSQIKNDLIFAEKSGYTFRLYVRPGIILAPKIREAVDEGKIVLQYLNLP